MADRAANLSKHGEGFVLNLQELQQEYFQISLTFLCHQRHRAHTDLRLAACWHQAAGWQGFSPTHTLTLRGRVKQRLKRANESHPRTATQQPRLLGLLQGWGGWGVLRE